MLHGLRISLYIYLNHCKHFLFWIWIKNQEIVKRFQSQPAGNYFSRWVSKKQLHFLHPSCFVNLVTLCSCKGGIFSVIFVTLCIMTKVLNLIFTRSNQQNAFSLSSNLCFFIMIKMCCFCYSVYVMCLGRTVPQFGTRVLNFIM